MFWVLEISPFVWYSSRHVRNFFSKEIKLEEEVSFHLSFYVYLWDCKQSTLRASPTGESRTASPYLKVGSHWTIADAMSQTVKFQLCRLATHFCYVVNTINEAFYLAFTVGIAHCDKIFRSLKMYLHRAKAEYVYNFPFCLHFRSVWIYLTARKRSCGKVMFLHLSVILSTGRGLPLDREPPPEKTSFCVKFYYLDGEGGSSGGRFT